jgi:hypothetical protein
MSVRHVSVRIGFVVAAVVLIAVAYRWLRPEPRLPEAPQAVRDRALAPPVQSKKVSARLKIDDSPATPGQRRAYPAGQILSLAVEDVSITGGVKVTAAVVKCVQIVDNKVQNGASAAMQLPGPAVSMELPRKAGEWELRVLTADTNELICSQLIEIVE